MKSKRQTVYQDYLIQGRLLGLLIIMQFVLISLGIIYLYIEFDKIFDSQIFQVHAEANSVTNELLGALLSALVFILVSNILAVIVAHFIWVSYVNSVIRYCSFMLCRLRDLDFRAVDVPPYRSHPLLEVLNDWREAERVLGEELRTEASILQSEDKVALRKSAGIMLKRLDYSS